MCCEDTFLKRLRARGLRLTPQREMILQAMHEVEPHATAEEVYARVSALSSAIDLSTVYRTLELLQEFRLVASIDLGDGQLRYELLGLHGHHHHLHCRACGELIRVEQDEIQGLIEALAETYGFAAEPEHLIIPGLCERCRRAAEARQAA
jgi:Fur family ferric uptake transcriptional regulator